MENVSPIRLAIIGAGSTGRAYAAAVAAHSSYDLVAVVDPQMDRARGLAGEHPAYATLHDLLDDIAANGVQAAVVCAPTAVHTPLITKLLERNIGVLCHPPLAPSRPSSRMILDTARRSSMPLLVALDHRRADEIAMAADLLANGDLGDVRHVRVHLRDTKSADAGIIRELGTVALDLVRSLVGPIRHVGADAADVSDARTTTAQLLVRSETGISASVVLSADSALDAGWEILVEGAQGALRIDANGLARHSGLGWEPQCARTTIGELRNRHLDDFAAAVRSDNPSLAFDATNTLAAVSVLEAARRSVEVGGWARVIDDRVSVLR
jgi:predicted dehydrogenase